MGKTGSFNTKQISYTIIFSIMVMGVNYLISFLLTPYITTALGTEAYGFVTLAKTIANYGIVITSCLNTYSSRFITVAYHENNCEKANRYYSSVVISNVVLLVLITALDFLFIWKIESIIVIPEHLLYDVKILFFVDIFNYMFLALANVFNAYAYIKNKLDRIHIVRLISYLGEGILLLFFFSRFEPKVYYVGYALVGSTAILFVLNYILAKRHIPELSINIKFFSMKAVKDLVLSGIWNAINNIGNLLNSGLDLWVSNLLLSATAMGELSIVKTVSTIFTTIAQLISSPFQPQLLEQYSKKNTNEIVKIFNRQIRLSGYVVCVIVASFISIGKAYFHLWTPNQNNSLLYIIAIITVFGFLFEGIATPLFYTYTLTLKNKIPCIVTVISGVLNVVGMYVLIRYFDLGLFAVVGTTSVLGFFTYFIFTPLYSSYCLTVKWNSFYKSMIKVILSTLFTSIFAMIIPIRNFANTWIGFCICVLIICVLSAFMHFCLVLTNDERNIIIEKIKGRLNNGK